VKSSIRRALRAAIVVFVCAAIAASCNSSPVEIDSTFEAAGNASWLEVSPIQVNLGSSASTASVTLKTSSNKTLSWTASESAGWLSLSGTSGSLSSGSPKNLSLSAQRAGLAAGDYSTNVTIATDPGGNSATIRVNMTVAATGTTTFAVAPLLLDFGSTATSLSVTLKNTGSSSVSWTATESVGWLALNATSGTIAANDCRELAEDGRDLRQPLGKDGGSLLHERAVLGRHGRVCHRGGDHGRALLGNRAPGRPVGQPVHGRRVVGHHGAIRRQVGDDQLVWHVHDLRIADEQPAAADPYGLRRL
jgi:hypothetical protein